MREPDGVWLLVRAAPKSLFELSFGRGATAGRGATDGLFSMSAAGCRAFGFHAGAWISAKAVSYTHLTLPTKA